MTMHFFIDRPTGTLANTMLGHMYLAVDLFMILSGFVLASVYGDAAQKSRLGEWFPAFMRHRLARIGPLMWLVTICAYLVWSAGYYRLLSAVSVPDLIANLLMVQAWLVGGVSIVFVAWSVSVEWAANLFFPAILKAFWSRSRTESLVCAFLLLLCIGVCAAFYGQLNRLPLSGAVDLTNFPLNFVRCLPEFCLGVLCWRLRSSLAVFSRDAVLAPVCIALVLLLPFPQLDVLAIALLCVLVIGASFDTSVTAKALGSQIVYALGTVSFSIYLLHGLALGLPRRAIAIWLEDGFHLPHAWTLVAMASIVGTIILSFASYYYVEIPLRRALRGRARTMVQTS